MYNWIDRALLSYWRKGEVKARAWRSLAEAWKQSKDTANIAIVCIDGRIIYERFL